jgi:hypothetical protein
MSKKKKGDILEWMVYVLEQSLASAPYTIQRNVKLSDQHGVLREIDIYVEVTVNNKLLKYAFECRNFKSGIKLAHISDFNDKITNTGIKGYFVTTSQYQSGAIEKAKAVSIDLLKLHKRLTDNDDIKQMVMVWKQYNITSIDMLGNPLQANGEPLAETIKNCPTCSSAIIETIEQDVIPFLGQNIDEAVEQWKPEFGDIKRLASLIGEANSKDFYCYVNMPDSSITHAGVKITFDWLRLGLKVWNEIAAQKPVNRNSYAYLDGAGADILKSFSVNEFLFKDQGLILGISTLMDGKRKIAITDSINKETKIEDLVVLGHIDELGLRSILESKAEGSNSSNAHSH